MFFTSLTWKVRSFDTNAADILRWLFEDIISGSDRMTRFTSYIYFVCGYI